MAVNGGGPVPVLWSWAFVGLGVFVDDGAFAFFGFGAGVAPPYFSRSSWVELYFVAAFSLSIVFVRSACWSSRRWVMVSIL